MSCHRSQTGKRCYYYCDYCNHDWRLVQQMGSLLREAFPDFQDQCDAELVARAVRQTIRQRAPELEARADALVQQADTHIQLHFDDIPKLSSGQPEPDPEGLF